jgi:glycosyltransferase involved in cell wall biosynthesis
MRKNSLASENINFHMKRMHLLFQKGPLFYAEFNIRLFIYLLFFHADIVVANDLDTLTAVCLACWLKRIPVVYDSHEYFTGLPELADRPFIKGIWQRIEKSFLPHIKYACTVSAPIASRYQEIYGISIKVIRNLPYRIDNVPEKNMTGETEKRIIYQGALNMGRGIELAVSAMKYMDNCRLLIAGSGYLEAELRELSKSIGVTDKVQFLGLLPPDQLVKHTMKAHLGISLEENTSLNYYYALPNKVFDYIQARIPVLVSDNRGMAAIINKYEVGMTTEVRDPWELSKVFNIMLYDEKLRTLWKTKLAEASAELCWENEEPELLELYRKVIRDHVSSEAGR